MNPLSPVPGMTSQLSNNVEKYGDGGLTVKYSRSIEVPLSKTNFDPL